MWRAEQLPFGGLAPGEPSIDDIENNLRFPGQYFDSETGLHQNWFRDYSPSIGRYVQADPIGLAFETNSYAYTAGNPQNRVDERGLSSLMFDATRHRLFVVNGAGQLVGEFPAGNNAQKGSRGPWPVGTYEFDYWVPHAGAGPDSSYGSYGNFVFAVKGCKGCGVHSGRAHLQDKAHRAGTEYATNGCIRSTDDATRLILDLTNHGDPLRSLTVTRNPIPTNMPGIDVDVLGAPSLYLPDYQ